MFLAAPALLALSHTAGICSVPRSLEENKGLHTPRHSTPPTAEEACCHQWVFACTSLALWRGTWRTMEKRGGSRLCGRTGTSWSPGFPTWAQPLIPLRRKLFLWEFCIITIAAGLKGTQGDRCSESTRLSGSTGTE